MDGRSDRGTNDRRERVRRQAIGVVTTVLTVGVMGLMAGPARASGIHAHHLIVVSNAESLGPAWARFLTGGRALWEIARPPRFPSRLVLPTSLGKLVDTPFVEYLDWRRSLDPTRFDRYHPIVGPELSRFVPTVTSVPAASATGGGHRPFNPTPQNLPEPGTLGIAIVLIGAGLAMRNRSRGRKR